MDAGRGPDRLTIVEQPPRPPTTFFSTSMDSLNQQQQQQHQLRAGTGYTDLCRAQGPADSLTTAYHNRYLASLPALSSTSGSTFPFLGNMFASGPTSPFRAPSAPGIGNCGNNGTTNPMRQQLFWPPTPPPDGYGRYGLNTSLFPLFGSVSPSPTDGSAAAAAYMLSQGLVSRHLTPCTSTTVSSSHHLLDPHKEQGFFPSGFGLGSPLTPSSQMSGTNPFSHHLIPPPHPLDYNKFPGFCPTSGLNSSNNTKDFLTEDSKSQSHHHHHHHNHHHSTNCPPTVKSENNTTIPSVKHKPSETSSTKSSKHDKTGLDKKPSRSKDTRLQEDVKSKKSPEDSVTKQYQESRQMYFSTSNVKECPPFDIDVSCDSNFKPDILSPPIESPSDTSAVESSYPEKKKDTVSSDNTCLNCANECFNKISKVSEEDDDDNSVVVDVDNVDKSSPKFDNTEDAVPVDSSITAVMEKSENAVFCNGRSDTPKIELTPQCPPVQQKSSFSTYDKAVNNASVANIRTDSLSNTSGKHVTAAVIPTAPKQQHISNYINCLDSLNSHQILDSDTGDKSLRTLSSESPKLTISALSKMKSETSDYVETTLPVMYRQNISSNCCRTQNNKNAGVKVKDMVKTTENSSKQSNSEVAEGQLSEAQDKPFQTSPAVVKLCPMVSEKSTQDKICESKKKVVAPLKTESPVYRFDPINDFSEKPTTNWSKATVSPYNWHQKEEDPQAINLTINKKNIESCSPVPITDNISNTMDVVAETRTTPTLVKPTVSTENVNLTSGNTACCVSGTGVIGVCHPNINKGKMFAVGGSVSKFSTVTSVMSQMDVSNDGEVHLASVHQTKSSTFQTLNATTCLNRAASVTGFQNSKTQLKTERLTPQMRTKSKDNEKIISSGNRATTLATLAPKLTKKVGFLKDTKSSHTLSTSSSMSSTSIVFPATVNPCIPVGIAIAQQRQDSSASATVGKNQSSTSSTNPSSQLTTNRITTEIQSTQEIIRDQKSQEISCPNASVASDSTNFLVTPGPTIVSRQWESEAVTRATLPSPWVAHGSIISPALWIGQGAAATAAYATAAPASAQQLPGPLPAPVNSIETPPISLPPGGYQLARDSVTGHLFLIPAANIVDRTAMWPSYSPTAGGTLPIQQLVTQQHQTHFEQVLPQVSEQEHVQDCLALSVQQTHIEESNKDVRVVDNCCDTTTNYKQAEIQTIKSEDKDHASSVPLASGQTFTFTTFPTPCDPSGFSYVLQSSTVMHLAHTAQTTSIQNDSGKRSQGTSPLHPATPSPSPICTSSLTALSEEDEEEEEEEHEDEMVSVDSPQVKTVQLSVTTAVQVDMDSRTNSEEEYEEEEIKSIPIDNEHIKMSDSAIQTEGGLSDSGKGDSESEELPTEEKPSVENESTPYRQENLPTTADEKEPSEIVVTEESEIAPSLPVESQPVRDFIDHHGLDLLVDSIEEFASREQQNETQSNDNKPNSISIVKTEPIELIPEQQQEKQDLPSSTFSTLDTSCTDGLGLLCALAEQRFFEEALNENESKTPEVKKSYDCYSFPDEDDSCNMNTRYSSPKKDNQRNVSSFQDGLDESVDVESSSNLIDCEQKMRKQIADLQKELKRKQLELAKLTPSHEKREGGLLTTHKKKIYTLPRFKSKNVMLTKSASRFQSHSYKIMAQKLANSRAHLSNSLKKKSFETQKNTSINHSKSSSVLQSENKKSKKPKKMESFHKLSKESKKFDAMKKTVENGTFYKSIISKNPGHLKVPNSKNKVSSNRKQSDIKNCLASSEIDAKNFEKSSKINGLPSKCKEEKNSISIPHKKSNNNITLKRKPSKINEPHIKKIKLEKVQSDTSNTKNDLELNKTIKVEAFDCEDSKDKNKPKFDEQAWFVRRSERIFLSDAKPLPPVSVVTSSSLTKKINTSTNLPIKVESGIKDKKEATSKPKLSKPNAIVKSEKEDKPLKNKLITKQKTKPSELVKKRCVSTSSSSNKSSDISSDSESSSDESSVHSTSTNIPPTIKEKNEKQETEKKNASNDFLKSCILNPSSIVDKTRVLVLDEGLFYAGHIVSIEAPDVYGIVLDGDRAHRPHIFSREEILIATVLEVKPAETSQLCEGSRVCAYWSQQYRCLYPGTVAKASSPLPDPSLLYVEFDDGDSGRIPIEDIRILPPDFPIVSTEPNPLLLLGKRRPRLEKECSNDLKSQTSIQKNLNEKNPQKDCQKVKKKRSDSVDGKSSRDRSKSENRSLSKTSNQKLSTIDKPKSKKIKTKDDEKKKKLHVRDSSSDNQLKGKKRKKHHDEHKHHHKHKHHHHKHHHKKHKLLHSDENENSQDIKSPLHEGEMVILTAEKTSDLTMTIKTSPSPHTAVNTHNDHHLNTDLSTKDDSSDEETSHSKPKTKTNKKKKTIPDVKPAKRKERVPSVEKSKIAAFLPIRQLWKWSGKSYKRPGAKGKGKKEFYRAIQRGKELLRVGDCAVFLSTGRPHLPYIGRIEMMWESWGGKMDVRVKWFYHPEETKSSKKLTQLKGALFQSPHFDENDVQTISHKCEVISWMEYQKHKDKSENNIFDNNDTYYLAGTYDPITGNLIMEPDIPKIPGINCPEK